MPNALTAQFLSDPYVKAIYDDVRDEVVKTPVLPLPPKYRNMKFSDMNKGIATIRIFYIVESITGISYFGYKVTDDGVPVEIGITGVGEEFPYTEINAWLSSVTSVDKMAIDIVAVIYKIFKEMWRAGKSVDFAGIEILGIYSFEKEMDIETAVKQIVRAEPYLSLRKIYKSLRDNYEIKIGSRLSEVNKLVRYYRDVYQAKMEKIIKNKVIWYIKNNHRVLKKDIVMELKKEGFYVDKKVSKLITNLIMDYSEDKDERVKREMKKIAKYLKKVEEKVSQNKIIKEYRERGYRGRDKYLRGIAKEVIDEIV